MIMKDLKDIYESILDDEDELASDIINKIKLSIKNFLEENYEDLKDYKISDEPNEDGKYVIDCNSDLIVAKRGIFALTNEHFVFGKVKRNFYCSNCKNLTSLKGAPREVGKICNCSHCYSLKSLEDAPEKVGGNFECNNCISLTSLKGAPKVIEEDFECSYCRSLISLEGAPKVVGDDFIIYNCGKHFTDDDVFKVSKILNLR